MACEHIPVENTYELLVVITNGSPCQDLTSVSNLGTAGFAGTRSVHFHVLPFIIYRIKQMIPSAVIVAI
eukprot:12931455-Heterocapsa_arctica.AAC.1